MLNLQAHPHPELKLMSSRAMSPVKDDPLVAINATYGDMQQTQIN